jgi:retron-type reverse transcriptase
MSIKFIHGIEKIGATDNLLEAWTEFVKGKSSKTDVQEFSLRLMNEIITLHDKIVNLSYQHGGYVAFNISDPKPRNIHKAGVRDRLVHHAIYRVLYPFFDRTFIADSYSCREGKGTHKALNRFREFAYKVSKNNTRTCWVLKCDIRKFFANIDHKILLDILKKYIVDPGVNGLLAEIVSSFSSTRPGIGLPLGNLTSQLLVNIYMNEFDQFVKHKLKAKHYIRYADDFVFLSEDRERLEGLVPKIAQFLETELKLALHPDKLFMKTLASGVDFLGWVHFPGHSVLRTATKRRMMSNIRKKPELAVLASYQGLLGHGNAFGLTQTLKDTYDLLRDSPK